MSPSVQDSTTFAEEIVNQSAIEGHPNLASALRENFDEFVDTQYVHNILFIFLNHKIDVSICSELKVTLLIFISPKKTDMHVKNWIKKIDQ